MENNNQIKRVFNLVLYCFSIYFILSIIFRVFNYSWEPFDRVNLIADIFPKKADVQKNQPIKVTPIKIKEKPQQSFDLYKKANLITNFYEGDSVALPKLMAKLQQLKNGGNEKIRIAYFGDSMIEADLLTQTFRQLLQKEYGGYGVGYVPITSKVSGMRQTVSASASGWDDINFMTKGAKNLYFSGHIFKGAGSGTYRDNTIAGEQIPIQKALLFGNTQNTPIIANSSEIILNGPNLVNRQVLSNDNAHLLKLKINNPTLPVFGVSFESDKGVFVDNFSFRGITGVELNKLDSDFINAIQQANHYDLIIFQYGVNLLFRPNDVDYSYYAKMINPVLNKFKNNLPDTEILIISSADRAFRYNGEYKTAIGLPNLIELQAKLAIDNGFSFYNLFETMGGTNSIIKWASEKPSLANKDYVHPNHKGAEILGKKLFEAVQNDFNKLKKEK